MLLVPNDDHLWIVLRFRALKYAGDGPRELLNIWILTVAYLFYLE